jgi:hypothetical protein
MVDGSFFAVLYILEDTGTFVHPRLSLIAIRLAGNPSAISLMGCFREGISS